MCRPTTITSKSSDNSEAQTIKMSSPHLGKKSPSQLFVHAIFSACALGFVLVALLLPSAEPNTGSTSTTTTVHGSSTMASSSSSSIIDTPTAAPELSRGKVIGSTFRAKDLYQAYREIQQDYQERAFSPNAKWKILAQHDDIEVALSEHPTDPLCPYVRLTGTIPVPVSMCWDFLMLDNWDENMPKMDPFYEGLEMYGDFSYDKVNIRLARKRTTRIVAFKKRDFVFLSVAEDVPLKDGTWVSGTVSVQTPTIPRHNDYTRAYQDSIAFYKPVMVDGQEHTQITIVCRIDLNDNSGGDDAKGGWVPMWIYVKTVGATGARSVASMRDVLIEQYKLQQQKDDDGLRKDENGVSNAIGSSWMSRVWSQKPETTKIVVPDDGDDSGGIQSSSKQNRPRRKLPFFGKSKGKKTSRSDTSAP